jgi:hypothetical protein
MDTPRRWASVAIRKATALGLIAFNPASMSWGESVAFTEAPPLPPVTPIATPGATADDDSPTLTEIVVHAAEPRFVVPTRRDRIGRVWAPVYINGHGPFRLVLDSGANHSGITAQVAQSLDLPLDSSRPAMLRGVTGSAAVPTIEVDSFRVGDLQEGSERLPLIIDPLGGADGILGTAGMDNRRIYIDFQHDYISIVRSKGERPPPGFQIIPFELIRGHLLAVEGTVDGVRTKAIIDTGGEVTIANLALRQALERHRLEGQTVQIEGVTADVQEAQALRTPPLRLYSTDRSNSFIEIQYHDVSYADMYIFELWGLTKEPAMLVGMDALGLVNTLVIDYPRHELFIRTRPEG